MVYNYCINLYSFFLYRGNVSRTHFNVFGIFPYQDKSLLTGLISRLFLALSLNRPQNIDDKRPTF